MWGEWRDGGGHGRAGAVLRHMCLPPAAQGNDSLENPPYWVASVEVAGLSLPKYQGPLCEFAPGRSVRDATDRPGANSHSGPYILVKKGCHLGTGNPYGDSKGNHSLWPPEANTCGATPRPRAHAPHHRATPPTFGPRDGYRLVGCSNKKQALERPSLQGLPASVVPVPPAEGGGIGDSVCTEIVSFVSRSAYLGLGVMSSRE